MNASSGLEWAIDSWHGRPHTTLTINTAPPNGLRDWHKKMTDICICITQRFDFFIWLSGRSKGDTMENSNKKTDTDGWTEEM